MATEQRAKPKGLMLLLFDLARLFWKCPGTSRRGDPLILCAECLVHKEVAWSFLHWDSIASFPGSCVIGNAVKSKEEEVN